MSAKTHKKNKNFAHYLKNIQHIISDVVYMYKNFLHWNISKVCISLFSLCLGFLFALPIFAIMIVFGVLDGVNWLDMMVTLQSGSDISLGVINSLAAHPYAVVFVVFLFTITLFLFLLGSSYVLLLKAHLSLGYIKRKKVHCKKNYYFKKAFILRYFGIMSLNIMYILLPIMIWAGVIFFMYLFYNIGFIGFNRLSILVGISIILLILCEIYLVYRLTFGYIILADDTRKKHLRKPIEYVRDSIEITKGYTFLKFIPLYIAFAIVIAPISLFDNHLESKVGYMRDTLIFKSGLLQNLDDDQIEYYEYISREYKDLNNEEITSQLRSASILRIVLYFLSYFLFSGLFVMVVCSFYKRILVKK